MFTTVVIASAVPKSIKIFFYVQKIVVKLWCDFITRVTVSNANQRIYE